MDGASIYMLQYNGKKKTKVKYSLTFDVIIPPAFMPRRI